MPANLLRYWAPIAQGIEHCPPEAGAAVRICLGAPHKIAGQKLLRLRPSRCQFGSWQRFGNIRAKNLLIEGGRNGVEVTVETTREGAEWSRHWLEPHGAKRDHPHPRRTRRAAGHAASRRVQLSCTSTRSVHHRAFRRKISPIRQLPETDQHLDAFPRPGFSLEASALSVHAVIAKIRAP